MHAGSAVRPPPPATRSTVYSASGRKHSYRADVTRALSDTMSATIFEEETFCHLQRKHGSFNRNGRASRTPAINEPVSSAGINCHLKLEASTFGASCQSKQFCRSKVTVISNRQLNTRWPQAILAIKYHTRTRKRTDNR